MLTIDYTQTIVSLYNFRMAILCEWAGPAGQKIERINLAVFEPLLQGRILVQFLKFCVGL